MIAAPKLLHDNRLEDATPVASTTATGFAVINLTDFRPYTWWKPSSVPATVTVDCATAKAVDYWGLAGHNLFTVTGSVQLRGSTDNFSASDVLVDSVTPGSDAAFMRYITSTSYRYWRLTFTGAVPTVAIALLGAALTFPRGIQIGFDPIGRKTEAVYNISSKGYPLGSVVNFESYEFDIDMRYLLATWVRTTFKAAWEAHLNSTPFVFAWDPTDHIAELYLVWAKSGFKTPHQPESYADLNLKLEGMAL